MKSTYVSSADLEVISKGPDLLTDYLDENISTFGLEIISKGPDLLTEYLDKSVSNVSIEVISKYPQPLIYNNIYLSSQSIEILTAYEPTKTHYVSGYVKEESLNVSRRIYMYDQEGSYITNTSISEVDGSFTILTTITGIVYLVCVDDNAGLDFNDLVVATVTTMEL